MPRGAVVISLTTCEEDAEGNGNDDDADGDGNHTTGTHPEARA
jgi:hypothetical protein